MADRERSPVKTMKTQTVVALAVVLGCGALALGVISRLTPRSPASPAPPAASGERARNLAPPTAPAPAPRTMIRGSESAPMLAGGQAKPEGPQFKAPIPPARPSPASRAPEPVQDPLARAALSLVGADSDAETYWDMAINDPSLSAHERQDLIEDLNEDGFPDPEHPTVDDLPLIVSRIFLIEELAPDAMDKVNWDAFLEAHKDLVNMYARLTQP